jgi:hypothetical protein
VLQDFPRHGGRCSVWSLGRLSRNDKLEPSHHTSSVHSSHTSRDQPLADCKSSRVGFNMHWAETAMPHELQPNAGFSTLLPEDLRLSMGTLHGERMVCGEVVKPRSRTTLSLDDFLDAIANALDLEGQNCFPAGCMAATRNSYPPPKAAPSGACLSIA